MTRMLIAVLGLLVLMDAPAAAQFDHLHCYKVRPDHSVRADVAVASAIPELPAHPGCRVKGPKLFCGPIDKTLIRSDPPAAGAPPGSATGSFLCYAARCPDAPGSFEASDQFGTYTLRRRKSVLLCAPARTPTTTTTTGPSTTTSTTLPICGVPAEPACNGTCPPGQECVVLSFGPGLTGCGCAAVPGCRNTGGGVCGGNCPPGCLTACVSPECFCICA